MLMMPLGIVPFWITGLLSLGLLGGGIYLGWAWYEGVVIGTGYLVSSIAMVLFSLLGRLLMLALLGRKTGTTNHDVVPARSHRLTRPDGTILHIEEAGPDDAPTLLLTHGWGLSSAVWRDMKQHLAGRYRLVMWDLPGLGRSTGPKRADYSLEKMAGDLEAVVAFCGPGPIVLLGHSIGGMITLTLCRLSPHLLGTRVSGLVLADTTYTNPVRTARFHAVLRILQKPILEPLLFLQILLTPLVWVLNWLSYLNGTVHLLTHLTQFGGKETSEQLDFVCRYSLRDSPAVIARGMFGMFRYDATEVLPTISVPVLVINGDRDQLTLPEAGETIRATVPRGERAEVRPAGHLAFMEKNEEVDAAVRSFAAACLPDLGAHSSRSARSRDTTLSAS
ncbi:MAG: alpha/beta hydrolase fold protein [Chthonomonadales bacterium]|nr:alpha/beta hydrolase fold protein [Chthonomonadales bacterium]